MSLREPPSDDSNSNQNRIENRAKSKNTIVRCGRNSLLTFLAIAAVITFTCLKIYIGAYQQPPPGNLSTDDILVFAGGNAIHGLERLQPYISFKAINGFLKDPRRQVHQTTRGGLSSRIKAWIDGFGRTESLKAINKFFAQREVHPGTRKRVLRQIKAWIDNPNPTERILWLHGPSGVGKSAIVQTITNSYSTEKVPANFFFLHSDASRNNGNHLVTTLAWQLTSSIPATKEHIARSLNEQPDLPTKDVETQFQKLIVRPFEAISDDEHQPQLSDMVVVINGLDQCVDERDQERILRVLGNVVMNPRIPLRFLISSRPEPHINKTINSFPGHTFSIDLAECVDADGDIEIYLKDKFAHIAKNQGMNSAIWPGQEAIQQLVYKASGHFLYASTVIKVVGGDDDDAKSLLDTILSLRPHTTQRFAELDRLYLEILERQSDQEFLKAFLTSLVAQNSLSVFRPSSHIAGCPYLHLREGYGILMNLSEQGLRIKLRNMKPLLRITPDYIGLHHRSFLAFLKDPSRSGRYNISTESAARHYLMSVIDSVAGSANESLKMIEHPDYYPPVPELVEIFGRYPTSFDNVLSKEEWREALQLLLNVQDQILNLPNFTIPRNQCTIFHVMHRLLSSISYRQFLFNNPKETHDAIMPLVLIRNMRDNLSSSLTYFRRLKEMYDLMSTLLRVDPDVIAMRVRSSSEAQNMIDHINSIVNGEYFVTSLFSAETPRKATKLALEIHTRVPVLPQFFLSTTYTDGSYRLRHCWSCDLEALSRVWLFSNVVDHLYILPVLGINVSSEHGMPSITLVSDDIGSIHDWRERNSPGSDEIISVMVNLARAIQYFHSIGIVISDTIELDDIYVDSNTRVRISPMELVWSAHGRSLQEVGQKYENNVEKLGEFFCVMYFGTESSCATVSMPSTYKLETSVHGNVWQLIKRCLSAKGKPSIDKVVQEMESWNV